METKEQKIQTLAKIEDIEEQNYNMIDNRLNDGLVLEAAE